MRTNHTPGPWKADKVLVRSDDNEEKNIALCCYGFIPEAEANAKLIAAAPELLQMVNDLKKCIERLTDDNLELHQEDRDKEAQWIGEAHELLLKVNPDYYKNANS